MPWPSVDRALSETVAAGTAPGTKAALSRSWSTADLPGAKASLGLADPAWAAGASAAASRLGGLAARPAKAQALAALSAEETRATVSLSSWVSGSTQRKWMASKLDVRTSVVARVAPLPPLSHVRLRGFGPWALQLRRVTSAAARAAWCSRVGEWGRMVGIEWRVARGGAHSFDSVKRISRSALAVLASISYLESLSSAERQHVMPQPPEANLRHLHESHSQHSHSECLPSDSKSLLTLVPST